MRHALKAFILIGAVLCTAVNAANLGTVSRYDVRNKFCRTKSVLFEQPRKGYRSCRKVQHTSDESITMKGFWDGDGMGGRQGNVFTMRFVEHH